MSIENWLVSGSNDDFAVKLFELLRKVGVRSDNASTITQERHTSTRESQHSPVVNQSIDLKLQCTLRL